MSYSITSFVGSIPALYDRYMGPALFEPYAIELAHRLPGDARAVLEIAAGTGRATRHLLARLAPDARLLATDLNQPMIDHAASEIRDPRVTWRQADAQALPSAAATHDAVVCQFGLMFIPDQPLALREMRRVLRPDGTLLLLTWNRLELNGWSIVLHEMLVEALPANPPTFVLTPFSLPEAQVLAGLATDAGFTRARVETIDLVGEVSSARDVALGLIRGNPLIGELAARGLDPDTLETRLGDRFVEAFGDAPCRAPMSAQLLVAQP